MHVVSRASYKRDVITVNQSKHYNTPPPPPSACHVANRRRIYVWDKAGSYIKHATKIITGKNIQKHPYRRKHKTKTHQSLEQKSDNIVPRANARQSQFILALFGHECKAIPPELQLGRNSLVFRAKFILLNQRIIKWCMINNTTLVK